MKIYLIGLYSYKENYGDVQYIVKATTSYESARQYIIDEISDYSKRNDVHDFKSYESEAKYCWDLYYNLFDGDRKIKVESIYRIEPIELVDSEDVSKIRRPELEKRCETLEKHNDELKKEVSELKMNNSAAQCYLSFWDGGKYEDLDHVLKNVKIAKVILRGGEQGNSHILELFEEWKNHEKD